MLILAFDTATSVSTVALVRGGEVLGEALSEPRRLLQQVNELMDAAGVGPQELTGIVVGLGPGSFTSTRIGVAYARGLGLGLDVPCAGVSSLDALAHGAPGATPVIDARRGEVFVSGPSVAVAWAIELAPGSLLVGDGACRYRDVLEERGAIVPPDGDPRHLPLARHHAALARSFGRAEDLEPLYVRLPDVDQARVSEARRMNVVYRPLSTDDLAEVLAIELESYPVPWTEGMFASELAKPTSLTLAAFEGSTGELVAYAVLARFVDEWHVMNVAVAQHRRREGIGAALLERIAVQAEIQGPDPMTLEVRVSNHGALALYERLGFERCGVRPRYYVDNGEDAVIMRRESSVARHAG